MKNIFVFMICLIGITIAQSTNRLEKLQRLSKESNDGIIDLDSALFTEFTKEPRNYSISVLMTVSKSTLDCPPCRLFDPEYRIVAKSWRRQPESNRHYFGILDFANGQDIFKKVQLNTAPVVLHYHPTEGAFKKRNKDPERYDMRSGTTAESFAHFVSQFIQASVPVKRPFNYIKAGIVTVSLGTTLALGKLAWPVARIIVFNKNTWSAISLVLILMFTSGHMWNHIRKPPYIVPNDKGGLSYIAGGFQNQFGLETQIMAVLYGLSAFCVVSLSSVAPKFDDPNRQRLAIFVWTGAFFVVFSLIISIFKMKNEGYPFKLLF